MTHTWDRIKNHSYLSPEEKVQKAVELFNTKKARLYRPDGQPLYSSVEMRECERLSLNVQGLRPGRRLVIRALEGILLAPFLSQHRQISNNRDVGILVTVWVPTRSISARKMDRALAHGVFFGHVDESRYHSRRVFRRLSA